jgi:hypothetical protein
VVKTIINLPAPSGPRPQFWYFEITLRHTTLGRTPLDEWWALRRDLYLTTHNTQNRHSSILPARFEPTVPASERPQTHALDRAVTRIGSNRIIRVYRCSFQFLWLTLNQSAAATHFLVSRCVCIFVIHTESLFCILVGQCFSTAGPRPGTGPWHQFYRAARGLRKLQYATRFHWSSW